MERLGGQAIAALSNMAEGLSNMVDVEPTLGDDYADMIGELVKRSIHPEVNLYKKPLKKVFFLGGFGYNLEHLNIALGCYQSVADDKYHEVNSQITEHLVMLSNQSAIV